MISAAEEFEVRRLVIAFGMETDAAELVTTAVALARQWDVSVAGMFFDNQAFRRVIQGEIGRQIGLGPLQATSLGAEQLELQIEGMARSFEAQLRSAAGPSIEVSFNLLEGDPVAGLRAQAGPGDLLILSASTRPVTRYARLTSMISRSIEKLGGSALILAGRLGEGPVVLLDEAGAGAGRSRAAAIRLAQVTRGLDVLVKAGADHWRKLRPELQRAGIAVRTHELRAFDLPEVLEAMPDRLAGLVLSSTSSLCSTPGIPKLVERFGCAVLMVSP